MTIEETKTYTLSQIYAGGLLLKRNGKPYHSKNAIRYILRRAKHAAAFNDGKNQLTYNIRGADLILLNTYVKKEEGSDRRGNGGRPRK